MAGTAGNWIVCNGYSLGVENSDTSFRFELDLVDAAKKQYQLRVNDTNQNVGLVQKTLRVIADRWPAYAFQFQANPNGDLTDIQ
jgi:hypothetical protein